MATLISRGQTGLAGVGFGVAAAFFYGSTVLFSRVLAKSGLPVPTVLGFRFSIAGTLLLAALVVARRSLLPPTDERVAAALLGTVGYAIQSALFFSGLQRGTAAAVTLLFYSFPAIVVLVEIPLYRKLPSRTTLAALLLSSLGVAAIIARSGSVSISRSGALIALGAGAAFAIYVLAGNRYLRATPAPVAALWVSAGTGLSVLTVGAVTTSIVWPGSYWWAILGNALATALAFAFLFASMSRVGAARTSVVMTLEAVFAILLTAAFLGEGIGPIQAIGGAGVLAGAILLAVSDARRAPSVPLVAEV